MTGLEQIAQREALTEGRVNKLRYFAKKINSGLAINSPANEWLPVYQQLEGAERVGKHLMDIGGAEFKKFITVFHKSGFDFTVSLNANFTSNDGTVHKWPDCLNTCLKNQDLK